MQRAGHDRLPAGAHGRCALAKAAVEYDIFARTSPEHKLRLVKALQDNGELSA